MPLFTKKTQADDLEKFRDITNDVIEADFVPYACHWDGNTVVTKNGELLQTIALGSIGSKDADSPEETTHLRSKIRETVLKCIDSNQYAVWIHTVRRKANFRTPGSYKRDFSGYLNHFWNDKNDWEHKFVNEVYLTIVREGKAANISDLHTFVRCAAPNVSNRHFEKHLVRICAEITAVTTKMVPMLSAFGARLLGVVKRSDGHYYSETCEFLGKLATLSELEVPMKDIDLSRLITDYDVTFGYNAMEVRMRTDGRRRFGAILTIREYRELKPAAIDYILQIPTEYIISQSFEFLPASVAIQGYEKQQQVFDISKAQGLFDKTGLKEILEDNKGRKTDFGRSQINFFLLADSMKALESGVANTVKTLASLGVTSMREDIKLEECYWAQLPANFEFVRRMNPIKTGHIGGFANLTDLPTGTRDKSHWGPAVTTFYTAAHTPYFFNFHVGDNGHVLVAGPPGTGKTVLINFLLSESQKYNGKVFYLDVNRSAEIFIRSIGGEYYNPYPQGTSDREYARATLNPFSLPDTIENRGFLSYWLVSLAGTNGANPALMDLCTKAVGYVFSLPQEQRHLKSCVQCMQNINPEAANLFIPWVEGGLGELFGYSDSLLLDKAIYGLELGDVLFNKETIAPVMLYLLQRIKTALNGSPSIIVLSEAWYMLDNPFLAPHIGRLLDEFRQKNAMVILATNHIEVALKSTLNRIFLEKTATQIYLPNSDADELYEEAFGLTALDTSYLIAMNVDDRHFLVKRRNTSVVLELDINGMADILAVLEGMPANLAKMEEVIQKFGLAHHHWMPAFLEMV